ncbi:PST1 [Auxenochlorella protothecoides x Auxenochlorella symbiontica]
MSAIAGAAVAGASCTRSMTRPSHVRPRAARTVSTSAVASADRPTAPKLQSHGRVFNFSAGPACLPAAVLEQAQADLLNWQGSGMSVMEMSHRGKEFIAITDKAEADLRSLLSIPDNYKVLFLQGGASTQFAAIPLNLAEEGDKADYVVTGAWSKKAIGEGKRFLLANAAATGDNKSIPDPSTWNLTEGAKYVHYCANETIGGVEFKAPPSVGDAPLVVDMSSNFCARPVDVSKYGVIYAGAQKNIGPAGVTIVIVREDLLGRARASTPAMLDWSVAAKDGSMYNTPPCWSIYMCGLVFAHVLANGGLEAVEANNEKKAKLVYDAVEASNGFYASPVAREARSLTNVPFTIPSSPDLEKAFIAEAAQAGMVQLKGHRSVGGMRASIYNFMPLEGVQTLADFMREFAARHA